jgi:hypothetical protein
MRLHCKVIPVIGVAVTALVSFAPQLSAQQHLVSPAELHQALINAAKGRRENLARVEGFFSSTPVQAILRKTGINPKQVHRAIPALSDRELAQLAARTGQIQNKFAAGALSNQQLTYIAIALATAVIVILIFEA